MRTILGMTQIKSNNKNVIINENSKNDANNNNNENN